MSDKNQKTNSACILYYSRYGNTEKIAKSLETGLRERGIRTSCTDLVEANIESLKDFDLIAIGAPTYNQTAPQSMKLFLEKMRTTKLTGKVGFAFDTRRDHFLAGSAAKYIERRLKKIGLKIILPYASAIIYTLTKQQESNKEVRRASAKLPDGEEKKFEQIGSRLGSLLGSGLT
jgi:flavorubredoxin